MALYLIGDVQGCDAALGRLLEKIDFSPSRDTLYLLGDLVNRGPESGAVLRRLMSYGDSARCLLGNHDLSLLAVAHGRRAPHRNDTMDKVLLAPDRGEMLEWLRQQRMAIRAHGLLMVHGGVLPQWDATRRWCWRRRWRPCCAGPTWCDFLSQMYGNEPAQWDDSLDGADRLRVIVNALTRLRFCTPEGVMDLELQAAWTTPRRVTCPGSTCRAARRPARPSRSGTGRRWVSCSGPTSFRWTPAASGAAA